MTTMWTVPFNEYLTFNGVKEGIQEKKYLKKVQSAHGYMQYGMQVEEAMHVVIGSMLDVKMLSPQMDIGFGADMQVSYEQDNKNYSMYVDITSSQKPGIKYYSMLDGFVDNPKDAFSYRTEGFNLYFGIKERHANWFFYEKPVVVLYVENFKPLTATNIDLSHLVNIRNYLMMMHTYLVRQGYGARASKQVRPNMRKFRVYYEMKELNKPEEYGSYIYKLIDRANR